MGKNSRERKDELMRTVKKFNPEPNKSTKSSSENVSWVWIVLIIFVVMGLLGKVF